MREVLFRGKRKDNGEWVEGYYCVFEDLHQIFVPYTDKEKELYKGHVFEHSSGTWEIVIPETVGQFTGLTDKNSTKIFEGDVIKGSWKTMLIVFYDEISTSYRVKTSTGYEREPSYYSVDKFEIIGNIHDNPELLGGVDDA